MVPADASSFGLGAVLLQKQTSGELKHVAYISRSMTPTEQRYAQIKKEALGFTWACERFSTYLLGLKFHIEINHKPLVLLFSTKGLDELPIRVQHFSTEKRLEEIRSCQETDPICQEVAKQSQKGWPNHGKQLRKDICPHFTVRAEISILEGILMRGCRLIIPSSMRPDILRKIHTGHQGIIKCREMVRQSVWWPGLSKDLDKAVKDYETCCKAQRSQYQSLIISNCLGRKWVHTFSNSNRSPTYSSFTTIQDLSK